MIGFLVTSSANILAAEQQAGVGHHVLLSIIGVDRTRDYPHFTGRLAQETTVEHGGIPGTIVRATECFEFAESTVQWGTEGDFSDVPPLLMQPVAVDDVAHRAGS
ncbi:SDR family oxidoreductase [uncultured Amnibacterium sp.]|uniref:SDR family oxidoreductase n=1 Tax=uncultured Amnibacterium sp. TaxID=1631851 RepID=UPI0035CABFEA